MREWKLSSSRREMYNGQEVLDKTKLLNILLDNVYKMSQVECNQMAPGHLIIT